MKALLTFVIIVLLGLVGCAPQVPVATGYPQTSQQKMQAVQHWDVLAADVARSLSGALAGVNGEGTTVLYVQPPENLYVFGRAFYNLLITELIQNGFGVSLDPLEADLEVAYDVQVTAESLDIDADYTSGSIPDSEVIITTSVVSGNRFVTRISNFYYINANDEGQYVACCPNIAPSRMIDVVGPE